MREEHLISKTPFMRALPFLLGLWLLLTPTRAWSQSEATVSAQDTLTVSLAEAVTHALRVSPEVDQRQAQRHFAEARSDQALASRYLTEFNLTTAHAVAPGLSIPDNNPFPTDALYLNPDVENDWDDLRPFNRIEVEGLQPIWTWGELSGNIRAARFGVAVEEAEVDIKTLEVAYRTAELYYNVLLADELFRIAEEAGSIVQRAQEEVQNLLDEGAQDVDNADLYQVQLTQQEYERRVVEVTQRRQTAYAALARQLFLPDETAVAPADNLLEPIDYSLDSLPTYFERALANRPIIDKAQAGLQARQAQLEVAESDYYPKLFLRFSGRASFARGRHRQPNPYISDPFYGRSLRAGFGFRQKLNFFQTEAQVEQARAQRNAVRHQQEAARQLVLFEVEQAYRNVITARGALEAQDQSLQISKEWLRTEQVNFDLALGDTENLVDAVRANLDLQVSYYQAVKEYNMAVLNLLETTGTLVQRLQSGMLVDNN